MDVWNASWNSNRQAPGERLVCRAWPTLGAAYAPRRPLSIARNDLHYRSDLLNNLAARRGRSNERSPTKQPGSAAIWDRIRPRRRRRRRN